MKVAARENRSTYLIQTVCHALDLLGQFNCDRAELGVTELSRRLALHKNNVFRLLATLESRNFIEQNSSTGNYRLGTKNLEMGQLYSRHMELRQLARPVLETMTAALKEASSIIIMQGGNMIPIDEVDSPLPVRVVSRPGVWLPFHCTAPGKVFLAGMHDKERRQLLSGELACRTRRTIVDKWLLLEELDKVAKCGYAMDDEEMEDGVRCVSVPVYDKTMQVAGAVAVTGPATRLGDERLEGEIIPVLLRSAAELTRRLGGEQP